MQGELKEFENKYPIVMDKFNGSIIRVEYFYNDKYVWFPLSRGLKSQSIMKL